MRRTYTAALWALLAAGIYSGIVGINALVTKPEWVYDPGAVVRPADYGPGGMEDALLVFGAGLVLVRVPVIWRWRRSVVAARRRAAARIEHEEPLLEDYGRPVADYRIGSPPVRPDVVANRAA